MRQIQYRAFPFLIAAITAFASTGGSWRIR
jgi:hypothetical protein